MQYLSYKDLDCYKKARELRVFISEIVKTFPAKEQYLLSNQVIRSSRSITANIAEGYGRYTYTDTRNFFIVARGSLTETTEHIQTAFDEKYIDEEIFTKANTIAENAGKLINGYISYLDKSKIKK